MSLNTNADMIGPFPQYYRLTVDGYRVPHVIGYKMDGGWHLVLDERFGIDITDNELQRFMWWIVEAMAISAGYTHAGGQKINLFGTTKVLEISSEENRENDIFPFPVSDKNNE